MELPIIHEDSHLNAVDVRIAAFPFLADGQRLSVGCNCRRVLVVNDLLASLIASIVIGQRCVGVSVQGIAVVTIVGNVLFDFGVKAVIRDVVILELGNGVVSLLTGVAVEGYGVLDAILEDTLTGEIPHDRPVLKACLGSIRPFRHGAIVTTRAVILVRALINLEQLGNLTSGGRHLIGRTIID